jgi:hypothetical protein
VLYVATVHYASPRWIEIQARYLRENLHVPYQTWTSLQGIDPSYSVHFDRVLDQRARHSDKLNHLAIEIASEASDSDFLMFLDGDAFPIADPMPLITDGLEKAPLVAVRQTEMVNDRQPHPCFCVTTVGAWRELPGDWSPGYKWLNSRGRTVSDVGGNLLRRLELTKTPWVEVLRTNRKMVDPYCFSVYGDVVYHHGAGFRTGQLTRGHLGLMPRPRPLAIDPYLPAVGRRYFWLTRHAWHLRTSRQLVRQSDHIYKRIQAGGTDWLSDFI